MAETEQSRRPSSLDPMVEAIWEESTRLETILVVHGYASLREALVRTLEHYGYRALEASSREQALRVSRREQPDLVLVELTLGENGGPVVAAMISAQPETRGIPVIALSSDVVSPELRRLHGFRDALVMPVEQRDLLGALDRALGPSRRRRAEGLRLDRSDEQCRLPLEDRLRCEHLSLFFRFATTSRVEIRPGNETLVHGITGRLAALGIQPGMSVENGDIVLSYELTIVDALCLDTPDPAEELFVALSHAFPELAARPEALRRRIGTLDAEFRRLQRLAS